MSDDMTCPSCGADLTGKDIECSITWSDGVIDSTLMPCPVCGRNLAERDPPELVSGGVSLFDE